MNRWFLTFSVLAALVGPLVAAPNPSHGDVERQADVRRHRAMAAAHEAAARCLESGKPEEQCQKDLQAACKGLAIGKFCGMKHEH